MGENDRPKPCPDCPFAGAAPQAAQEPGAPCEMLCHASGCLDGAGPDRLCEGWRRLREGAD
jgi:hypothetical protein